MRITRPQGRDRTPFFGRQKEHELLEDELRRGTGLVTLCGPSGIGKTRLARQVAGALFETFDEEGGTWFCSLADCRDVSDLEAAVASTLGIHQQGDELDRSLANRGPLLLILDNADSIASLCSEVIARWLERCVELQLIVTSLVPTGVVGEVVLELRLLAPDDAVALYLDRAASAWVDRSFSREEISDVRDLVMRLDRLPLAIELAAARIRILPPRTMLAMLEKRFELLRTSRAERPPDADAVQRKSSLLGALELTWSHLGPAEQLALARASVFEGGFTEEAANAVLDPGDDALEASSGRSGRELRRLLDDLQRKSLLIREEPRYFLLESVKEYALDQLRQMGRWEESILRHATFFLGQEHAQPRIGMEPTLADSIRWLRQERANLVAIHHRFLETRPSLAARAGLALTPFILNLSYASSDKSLSETTLDAARRSGEPALVLAALDAIHTSHLRRGSFDEGKAALGELQELAGRTGEKGIEALALARLALMLLDEGESERSHAPLQRAVLLSKEAGIPEIEAMALYAQGREAVERGAQGEAEAHLTRSIRLLQRDGQRSSGVLSLYVLGIAFANQGMHQEARRVMQDTIAACREHGHRHFEAGVFSNLASIDLAVGLLDEAEAAWRQSLAIFRELGNRFREGEIIGEFAIISLERGELDVAADQFAWAEEILSEYNAARMRIELLCFRAVVESKRGQIEEARRLLDEIRAHRGSGREKLNPLFAETVEAILEVATARQLRESDRQRTEGRIEWARLHLAALRREHLSVVNYLAVLARLLERELHDWDVGASPSSPRPGQALLLIGCDHDAFELPGQEQVSLRNRRILQRIFAVLVRARIETPGVAVDPYELIERSWPGAEEAAIGRTIKRLHKAISILRELGLRTILRTEEAGYLLDPAVPVHVLGAELPGVIAIDADDTRTS